MPARKGSALSGFLVFLIIIIAALWVAWSVWLSRARERARISACQANLRQISRAFRMYTQDWDLRLPRDTYQTHGGEQNWIRVTYPYLRNLCIQWCPSPVYPRMEAIRYQGLEFSHQWPLSNGGAYAVNSAYLFRPEPSPTVSVTQIKSPQATIMLADQAGSRKWDILAPIAGGGAGLDPPCSVALRHRRGANFAFADGHVKWLPSGGPWAKDDSLWDLK